MLLEVVQIALLRSYTGELQKQFRSSNKFIQVLWRVKGRPGPVSTRQEQLLQRQKTNVRTHYIF